MVHVVQAAEDAVDTSNGSAARAAQQSGTSGADALAGSAVHREPFVNGLTPPDAEATSGAEAEAGQPEAEPGSGLGLEAEADHGPEAVPVQSGAAPEGEQPAAQRLMSAEAGRPHVLQGGLHIISWEGKRALTSKAGGTWGSCPAFAQVGAEADAPC